jgi:hypothetical protein
MVQCEATPTIVAGVCDPGDPPKSGPREAGYNVCPIAARAEAPECYSKTGVFPAWSPIVDRTRQAVFGPGPCSGKARSTTGACIDGFEACQEVVDLAWRSRHDHWIGRRVERVRSVRGIAGGRRRRTSIGRHKLVSHDDPQRGKHQGD